MSRIWNSAQSAAFAHRSGNMIVSAGAGSGKTSVLTERVAQLVLEGTPIERILVLTFTNAAAREMKDRIRIRLLDAKHPSGALVDSSRIMTFDAFALQLVRQYHRELGLGPDVGVMDETFASILRKRMVGDVFDFMYAKGDPAFVRLISDYAIRKDDELQDFVLRIDAMADLKPDKREFLSNYLATHYDSRYIQSGMNAFSAMVKDQVARLKEQGQRFDSAEMRENYLNSFMVLTSCDSFDRLIEGLALYAFPRKVKDMEPDDKALFDALKDETGKFKRWSTVKDGKFVEERHLATKPFVAVIIDILTETDRRMQEYKKHVNRFTFSDIAKLAIDLVSDPTLQSELRNDIRYILIDEYQDTSDLQETFISHLAANNVFMVGDIKQSIYRFRNANCDIFNRKYERYAETIDGIKIDMNTNYRSKKTVIEAINDLFDGMMSAGLGGVDYRHGHHILAGNELYRRDGDGPTLADPFRYFTYEAKNSVEAEETEIRLIALDIKKKMASGHEVLIDKTYRRIGYDDFAILIDRRNSFEQFRRIFHEYGIPLDAVNVEGFSESDILNVFINLIKLLAHAKNEGFPNDDRHELVSVWRSFLYEYDDETIFQKLSELPRQGHDPVLMAVCTLAEKTNAMTLGGLVEELALTFELHAKAIRIGDVMRHAGKVEGLIAWCRSLEDYDLTIDDLVAQLEEAKQSGIAPNIEGGAMSGPAVQLMTIHKSKGLEFPIVYYPGLFKRFNHPETKSSFFAHGDYGIVMPLVDDEDAYGIFHYLVRYKEEQAALSEEVRKLYVAMTRAREQAIILRWQKDSKPLVSLHHAHSFDDLLSFINAASATNSIKMEIDPTSHETASTSVENINVEFRHVAIKTNLRKPQKASGAFLDGDQAMADYGLRLHEILSFIDWKDPKVPASAGTIGEDIAKLFKLDVFAQAAKAMAYPEYHFYDEKQSLHGIIDLILEYDNAVHIFDFKAGAIADPAYDRQVRIYGSYMKTQTDKPIILHLVSVSRLEVRVVAMEEATHV